MEEPVEAEARAAHRVLLVEDQSTLLEWVWATLAPHPDIKLVVSTDSSSAVACGRECVVHATLDAKRGAADWL